MRLPLLLLGSLAIPYTTQAEQGPIAPDRPGLSTGTHTVAPGLTYVEAGYQYAFNRSGNDTATHTLPQLVLRRGITDSLELDFIWDGWNQDHNQGAPNQTSRADLTLGGKYRLHQGEDLNLTLFGLVSIPVGSTPSTSDTVEPLLGLLWDCGISNKVQLFGALQAVRLEDNDDAFVEGQVAIGASYSHSDRLASFIEYFSAIPSESALDEQHIIDGGFTYLYSDDMQLDISIGVGLNESTSHFISAGVAYRF